MNEKILNALMNLFAIIANVNEEGISHDARNIVEAYLRQQLSSQLAEEYLKLFDDYLDFHLKDAKTGKSGKKRISSNSVKVLKICEQINENLHQKEKIIVLFRLIEYVNEDGNLTSNELDFISTVADTFNISQIEFASIRWFILNNQDLISNKKNILLIDSDKWETDDNASWFEKNQPVTLSGIKHIYNENLDGQIRILYIESIETFVFIYNGTQNLYLNGRNVHAKRMYVFDSGSIIKGNRITPVYQSDIAGRFLYASAATHVVFTAEDIEFTFKNSENGLHELRFSEDSGTLIGIMGGSGVGKSTLLNVLIGKYPLNKGHILINGYDMHKDKSLLEGLIGFVPQDDLLIEELSVYQNLYYNARLCFGNLNDVEINKLVDKVLSDLDLFEIKHLTVGNPLNKYISGGQRKRLNIALELIREPAILFVDEPTSGLSSMDSEMVMQLLKQQAIKGKLVIVNIHQPSSDIYKLFDKIWVMDKGGYIIFNGNPIDAVVYFKKMNAYVDADESECPTCGNVNPEQVLQIVESKLVNEFGKFTSERKVNPKEWYTLYKQNIESKLVMHEHNHLELPKIMFKIPSIFEQFKVFSIRNILSKLTNRQYMLINFLEAPLLAFILALFTKYINDDGVYLFADNKNLPVYLFMSIVVALFIGLTVSAEEIIRDRKILEREKFLNLSRFGYINSKVLIMFLLSAFQMLTFVLVGNTILDIKGMWWEYWLVLFSVSAAANLIGLNISSALNSVITIYILIPFIIVPQLLLGGAMVDFDDLHKSISNRVYVPLIGDLMVSRWGYEAIAVEQFTNNKFQKNFFEIEKRKSEAVYISSYMVSELENRIAKCNKLLESGKNPDEFKNNLNLLVNEIAELNSKLKAQKITFNKLDQLNPAKYTIAVANEAKEYLNSVKNYYIEIANLTNTQRDKKYNELNAFYGKDKVFKLQQDYHNKKLSDFMLDKMELNKLMEYNGKLIRKKDPVYMDPVSNYGRAHFYAPVKKLGTKKFDTFWFNLTILWLGILFGYLALMFDWLRKLFGIFDNVKIKRFSKPEAKN